MSSCGWFPLKHQEIVAWVERHRDTLPTTLAELAQYPMPFRTVIVNSVAPDVRVGLWTEHLRSSLTPESPLSAAQRAFVERSIAELPGLLAAPAPNPVMRDWESRMAEVFTRAEAGRIFATLGPPEPPEGLPLPPDAQPTPPA